ncbi:hypothetical protein L13192_01143 [Pyrenophora tritici-repentis]|nr:hypothetical protein L13192_01143 [Pyrenophora tritici-repentis]KAI1688487.1 hypothetical protein KJE20_01664 [Pyrenophora tritici-repentis]
MPSAGSTEKKPWANDRAHTANQRVQQVTASFLPKTKTDTKEHLPTLNTNRYTFFFPIPKSETCGR